MILPPFSAPQMVELARILIAEDEKNFKRGRDLQLVQGERLVLKSPDGTRYSVTVANDGTLSTTAL